MLSAADAACMSARAEFARLAQGPWREFLIPAPSGRPLCVLVETPSGPSVAPRNPVHDSPQALVFFDGLPLHSGFNAFDAASLAAHWGRTSEVLGRFTLVRINRADASLEIRTDPIASCPAYLATMPDYAWGITNVPSLAHRIAARGELDPLGVAGALCTPAALADRTLVTTVRTLPHASVIRVAAGQSPAVHTDDAAVTSGASRCDLRPDDAAGIFIDTITPVIARLRDAGFDLTCAITGGRDSRAVAALIAAIVPEPSYHFGGVEAAPESRVAARAAAALGGSFELKSDPHEPTRKNYDAAEHYLLNKYCGLIEFSYLRPPPSTEPDYNLPRHVHFTGHAGEIARWCFESLRGLATPPSLAASRKRLSTRMATDAGGLFTRPTLDEALRHIDDRIASARDAGVTRTNLQTVVSNQLKAPRWGALQLNRAAERRDIVAPFLCVPFFEVAFRLTPRDRFADAFHHAIIRRCAPAALGVPFHGYRDTRHRFKKELARDMLAAIPALQARHAKRKSPGRHANWEPWLRPALRDRLLSHDPAAPVWNHINRRELESILTDDTGHAFRERVYPVLAAAGVIRFWDHYTRNLAPGASTVTEPKPMATATA